jgi:hypothetical protein
MSFHRFVYYSAVVAGWGALVAWLLAEFLLRATGANAGAAALVVGILLGGAIATSLRVVSAITTTGLSPTDWFRELPQWGVSALVGCLGGGLGAGLGQLLFAAHLLPRALGWAAVGLAVGAADGAADRSPRKVRNGLLGGGLGGLLGGWLFDQLATPGAEMGARAVGFVALGLSIGAFVGLAQVVLREAWLTVLDGFRPGRRLILAQQTTLLGRGDHLPLPLLGYTARDLDSEHARIVRQSSGQFVLEDLGSRLGTSLNGQPIQRPTPLADGDLLRLGGNILRFNVRAGGSRGEVAEPRPADAGQAPKAVSSAPPPRGSHPERDGPHGPAPGAAGPPGPQTEGPPSHGGIAPPQHDPAKPPSAPPPARPSGGPRIPPPPPPPGI